MGLQYNLSIALLQDKRYAAADSAAQRLLEIDPKNKDAYRILAQSALERKDTVSATRQVDYLLAKDSTYLPAHLLRAQIAAERKDYKTSIRALDRVCLKMQVMRTSMSIELLCAITSMTCEVL